MEPTTHGLIALAVLALLLCMRRRRTGMSDETMLDLKRRQTANHWLGKEK